MPEQPYKRAASYREFAERFYKFEQSRNLFDIKVRGETFWEYVRYAVFYTFINSHHDLHVRESARKARWWLRKLDLAPRLVRAWLSPLDVRQQYDVVLLNYERTEPIDGKQVNKHMYYLAMLLASHHTVLVVDPHAYSVPRGLYPCDSVGIRGLEALESLKARATRFTRSEQAQFSHIRRLVHDSLGFEPDIERFARSLFAYQLGLRDQYARLLGSTGAKMMIFCDDASKKGVVAAAKLTGCRSVDYQHCLISRLNVLYTYDPGVNAQQIRQTTSDCIFTFGEYWHEEFRLPSPKRCVGFPYADRQFARFSGSVEQDAKAVLIVSSLYERAELIRTAEAICRALPDHRVYYRLRPEEYASWRYNYPAWTQETPNFVMIDSPDTPLYHYLALCKYQLGVNTTVLIEGMQFGSTIIVLRTGWYEELERLYAEGHALSADSPSEVVDLIRNARQPARRLLRERLFASGSDARVVEAVGELLH